MTAALVECGHLECRCGDGWPGRSQRLGNLVGANYVTNANGTVTMS